MDALEEISDELVPDSLLQKHRTLLDHHREELCTLMNPPGVIMQLMRQGVLTTMDQQTILARPADFDRNGAILDELFKRGPSALHELVRCLRSLDEKYSTIVSTLQPVCYRVLWFATSPAEAAAVVHALESYNDVKFTAFPRNLASKSTYIVRRATAFIKWVPIEDPNNDDEEAFDCIDDVEVCLIFPTAERSDYVIETLRAAFQKCPHPTVAVMSGVCDGDTEEVVVAKSLLTPSLTQPHFKPLTVQRFTKAYGFSPGTPVVGCVDKGVLSPTHLNTYSRMFYEACHRELPKETPYFVCVGVVNTKETKLAYTLLSCLVAIEICRTWLHNVYK